MPSDRSYIRLDGSRAGEALPPRARHDGPLFVELTVHAGPHGPRRLHVCRRGADLVVRHLDGRLLWLETTEGSAVRDPADLDRWVLDRHDPDLPPRLLPRDYGVEGVAIVSAEAFDDWFEAEEWEAPEATGTSRTWPAWPGVRRSCAPPSRGTAVASCTSTTAPGWSSRRAPGGRC